jgi:hypothetical protein
MDSQPLFHESFNDALQSAVRALGKHEAIARDLWPTKPNAGRYLSDCLNPDREAKLALEDMTALLRMARERGIHWAFYQLCDELGYAHPEIAARPTEEQRLAERMRRIVDEFTHLADEAAALRAKPPAVTTLKR